MGALSRYLSADHRYCDALFGLIEPLAALGEWPAAEQALLAFRSALEAHVDREERVLIPALEDAQCGPPALTEAVWIQHDGMRELLRQADASTLGRNGSGLAAAMHKLKIRMQEHCAHEEALLYPAAEALLGDRAAALLQSMEGLGAPAPQS